MAARGRPQAYREALGMSGVACAQLWFFVSAVTHATALKRNALAAGLHAGGPIDFSYPYGPGTFPTPRTTFGQDEWRTMTAVASCSCWHVTDATFHPAFPG